MNVSHSTTFVGKGKLIEIEHFVKENEIDLVIFDDDLTPSQLRNIEKQLCCKILDRSNLILDIFASRARTAHAKNPSRISPISVPFASFNSDVDPSRKAKKEE